jgi:hypothetical protein
MFKFSPYAQLSSKLDTIIKYGVNKQVTFRLKF